MTALPPEWWTSILDYRAPHFARSNLRHYGVGVSLFGPGTGNNLEVDDRDGGTVTIEDDCSICDSIVRFSVPLWAVDALLRLRNAERTEEHGSGI